MSLKVLIACGGTGGHLFPGLAVADELERRGHEVHLLISRKRVDTEALATHKPYAHTALAAIGWPGAGPKVFAFGWKLLQARGQCQEIFRRWKPDAVLGMGGFISAVPLLLAASRGLPSFIHESNAIPGKVTRRLALRMTSVFLGFAECGDKLPAQAKWRSTGTPVREKLRGVDRLAAAARLGLDPSCKTVLVMGGSQGARGINEALIRAMPYLGSCREGWQFLHLAGPEDASLLEINYRRENLKARIMEFCGEMGDAYAVSDLAVSRSGAGSLAEMASASLPSVLIPYPHAAENHQWFNAQLFERAGAGVSVSQEEAMQPAFGQMLAGLLGDAERVASLRQAAGALSHAAAASHVAAAIEQEARA